MRFSVLKFLESIGEQADDGVELRTQKRVLVMVSALVAFLALFWSAIYFAFGETLAALVPITYAVAVSISLVVFAETRRFKLFRFIQLSLILLLPFVLQIVLGGFVNGSVVILWALLAPVGALAISGRANAIRWLIAYAMSIVIAEILQPSLDIDSSLTAGVIAGFFVLNLVCPPAVAFFAMHYFVGQKDEILKQLDLESEKSERLLLNVLPKDIADELKEMGRTVAQHFPDVTVLFADIVGFTTLSERMDPTELVALLNDVFSYFDSLTARFKLEKIRTIGDSYMVVAGVPVDRADHAKAMANMALEMLAYEGITDGRLQFRIGMSSGPVVAGVVGTSKFQYDVWGDTVNTASRMESHGVPGKIQISSTTYALLAADFLCEARGVVEVKGKGQMSTWMLLGERVGANSLLPG